MEGQSEKPNLLNNSSLITSLVCNALPFTNTLVNSSGCLCVDPAGNYFQEKSNNFTMTRWKVSKWTSPQSSFIKNDKKRSVHFQYAVVISNNLQGEKKRQTAEKTYILSSSTATTEWKSNTSSWKKNAKLEKRNKRKMRK